MLCFVKCNSPGQKFVCHCPRFVFNITIKSINSTAGPFIVDYFIVVESIIFCLTARYTKLHSRFNIQSTIAISASYNPASDFVLEETDTPCRLFASVSSGSVPSLAHPAALQMDGQQGMQNIFHCTLYIDQPKSAHLPYLLKSPHYEITALCNSSVESAETAIKRHSLPSSTKAYGNPEDLAKDANVDLVVCCVRVDRHHRLTMPPLKAGKAVFVEWPLAANLAQAEEMLAAAKESGSKTMVGLQARAGPVVLKVKELVEAKAIGDLISSNLALTIGMPGDTHPATFDYGNDKKCGADSLAVFGGHLIDGVLYSLGGLDQVSAQLSTRWPDVKLVNADGTYNRTIKRDVPDHIYVQATLAKSVAPVSISIRNGKGFPNTPNFTWNILGTKGEMRITSAAPLNVGLGSEKIEVFNHEKDTVEIVDVGYAKEVRDLPVYGKNVGALYELYAKGGVEQGFVDFEQAVSMHKVLAAIEESSVGKKWVKVAA
jgi:predicted dehydrogenase